jgi:hypothetical protein
MELLGLNQNFTTSGMKKNNDFFLQREKEHSTFMVIAS